MVIAGGVWMQNASDSNQDKMTAIGVLVCRDNSYPFQERTLSLEQPIKIGRSVARARASSNNAIFDCKVLSRNHAVLWYDSGKFYLRDTKSSNGTFVNNKRLSPSGEDSLASEVCSGDIVQFGVDVVESIKKVTHGCIVATLKLYLPDGKEAKASLTTSVTYVNVTLEDLYRLNQFIQEAGRRERALRSKLEYMQQLIETTRVATNQSWKALILEDCLLSRLEMVENQLTAYSKNFSEDKIRTELIKLLEDKAQYQHAAKELLQKKLQEKREITEKVQILECHLNGAQEETQCLQQVIKENQTELQEFAKKYAKGQQNLKDITEKLQKTEDKLKSILQKVDREKEPHTRLFEDQLHIANNFDLHDSITDPVNIHKQITALRNYMQALHDKNLKLIADQSDIKNMMNPVETLSAILHKLHLMYIQLLDINSQRSIQEYEGINSEDFILHLKKSSCIGHICKKDHILAPLIMSTEIISNGIEDSKNIYDSDKKCDIILCDKNFTSAGRNTKLHFSQDTGENLCDEFAVDLSTEHLIHKNCNAEESRLDENELLNSKLAESLKSFNYELSPNDQHIRFLNLMKNPFSIVHKDNVKQLLDENYLTTLKPLLPLDCDYGIQVREYILRSLISNSNSLKEDDNSVVRQMLSKDLESLRNWLNHESDDSVVAKLQELHKEMKKEIQHIQEVNEQLVILKEKFNTSNKEKADLIKKYKVLKSQCGDLLNVSYSIPIHYVVPIVIAFTWLLLEKIL